MNDEDKSCLDKYSIIQYKQHLTIPLNVPPLRKTTIADNVSCIALQYLYCDVSF